MGSLAVLQVRSSTDLSHAKTLVLTLCVPDFCLNVHLTFKQILGKLRWARSRFCSSLHSHQRSDKCDTDGFFEDLYTRCAV